MLSLKVLACLALFMASSTAGSFAPSSPALHLQSLGPSRVAFRGGSSSDQPSDAAKLPSSSASQQQKQQVPSSSVQLGAAVDDNAQEQPPPPAADTTAADVEQANTAAVATKNTNMGPNAAPPGFLRKTLPGIAWHRIPNLLTYMRCIAIPLLMWLFYQPSSSKATSILFGLASFTDWLDGYLARRWDITSAFGAFLDPVADKLMVSTSLILLTGRYGKIIAIPTCIILARELSVSALREWMAQRGLRDSVKVGFQGKVKTAATMVALTLLLWAQDNSSKLYLPSVYMLYLCALVTVTSGSVYFKAAAPVLMESTK